jgi:DNA-binding MarR family transcriptional regulator
MRTVLQASKLPPDDAVLREFVADFYAAMSVMRLLRQELASSLSLSIAEYSVLLAVWYLEREGKMTVRAIADHLHVAAAYVTSEVGKLVDKGLLTKRPDPDDRRAVGVGLTRSARGVLARLAPMLREVNEPLFEGISYRDLLTVHRCLRGIIAHGYEAVRVAQQHQGSAAPRGMKRRRPSVAREAHRR